MRHSYLFIIAIMLAVMTPRIAPAQSIAVKSNVLYDLTGTLNLGGEIRCDDTHSFNLSVNYNPWNLGENKKMKHILIQPEYRWWLNETFIGSFFGVQAHFAQYNFGGTTPFTTVKNNRYQGNLIGCGITYGHQWCSAHSGVLKQAYLSDTPISPMINTVPPKETHSLRNPTPTMSGLPS